MYEKTKVNGKNIDPLYKALIQATNSKPKWNFHKYLVDAKGEVIASYNSYTKPLSNALLQNIETLLQQRKIHKPAAYTLNFSLDKNVYLF